MTVCSKAPGVFAPVNPLLHGAAVQRQSGKPALTETATNHHGKDHRMNSLPRLARDAAAQIDSIRRYQTLAALIGARWFIAATVGFASPEVREAFDSAIRAASADVERLG